MATQSFSQMNSVMRRYSNSIRENTKQLVADTTVHAATELARETPVDTGRARSNWQTSIGSPVDSSIFAYAPGQNLGRSEAANLVGVATQAEEEANRYLSLATVVGTDYPPMFVTNNVRYIGKLDEGQSLQAPPGMVLRALQKVTAFLRQQTRSLLIARGARPV